MEVSFMDKNILVISESLTGGGAERVAANLSDELSNVYNLYLLILNDKEQTYSTNSNVIHLGIKPPTSFFSKIMWYFKALKRVKKIKKTLNITHTISFLSKPDLLNVLTGTNNKTIVSVRNKRSSLNRNFFNKIKDKYIFNKADYIVSLSVGVKDDLIKFYGINSEKIEVIYNACDLEKIEIMAKENPYDIVDFNPTKGCTVITAGRLINQKGQWHLIRAFKKVVNFLPNVKLYILGQGEEKEYLSSLINDLGLSDSVKILGYKKNPYSYLSRCDLFVFSSLYEGFGNILLEAMACSLPIISTDCLVGPRELLEPNSSYDDTLVEEAKNCEYGILVPVFDGVKYSASDKLTSQEEIMADKIIEVLRDKKILKKYKNKSKTRILNFDKVAIINNWVNVINKL